MNNEQVGDMTTYVYNDFLSSIKIDIYKFKNKHNKEPHFILMNERTFYLIKMYIKNFVSNKAKDIKKGLIYGKEILISPELNDFDFKVY